MGQVSRLQRIWGPLFLYVRAAGQWASTDLVAAEQFFLGGVGPCAGTRWPSSRGTTGMRSPVRCAWPRRSSRTPSPFSGGPGATSSSCTASSTPAGRGSGSRFPDEPKSQQLTSVGGGLTVSVADNFLLQRRVLRGPWVPDHRTAGRTSSTFGPSSFSRGTRDGRPSNLVACVAGERRGLAHRRRAGGRRFRQAPRSCRERRSSPSRIRRRSRSCRSARPVVIQWRAFSIGSGELVRFVQPGATSLAVNRVTGGSASVILGQLLANGQIALINPAGISVGAGGLIRVAGLVATTSSFGRPTCSPGAFSSSKARAGSPRS